LAAAALLRELATRNQRVLDLNPSRGKAMPLFSRYHPRIAKIKYPSTWTFFEG